MTCLLQRKSLPAKTAPDMAGPSVGNLASSGPSSIIPTAVQDALRSNGSPLDSTTRAFMEPRFGRDFSQVRIHTDATAGRAAAAVAARAFTANQEIVFGANEYAPQTEGGRRLLSHELTHVLQQQSGRVLNSGIAPVNDPGEHEADATADAVMQGKLCGAPFHSSANGRSPPVLQSNSPGIQRAPDFKKLEANRVAQELQTVIDGATWKEIRKRVYPKESAAGIQRAKERSAGTRPDLTGLGRLTTLRHFAQAVRGMQSQWAAWTPDRRVKQLGDAANVELIGAEVPKFLAVDKEPMEFKGGFSPAAWKYVISESLATNDTFSNDDAAEVTNTTLHEARHAEQTFLAARFSAGTNKTSVPDLVKELHIPQPIAAAAAAKKFDARTDPKVAALGQRMYQAKATDGATNQAISNNDGIKELNKKRFAAQMALTELTRTNDSASLAEAKLKRDDLKAQITIVEEKYTLYRNIPYEADAHEVGDSAEEAFKSKP